MPWTDFSTKDLSSLLNGPRPDRGKPYFGRARHLPLSFLQIPALYGQAPVDDPRPDEWLATFWERYVDRAESNRIVLHKGGAYITLPYLYRGHRKYKEKQERKIDEIGKTWNKRTPGVLLTINPRGTGSPLRAYYSIKSNINRFMSWITKRKEGHRCRYIWCIEPTQRGYCHFHFIIEAKWIAPVKDILEWWQSQDVDIESPGVDLEAVKGVGQVQRYISKYVSKGFNDLKFLSLLYLTGGRTRGASNSFFHGLGRGLKTNSNPEWQYLGAFPIDYISWLMRITYPDPPPASDWKEIWSLTRIIKPVSTGMESRRRYIPLS